MAKPRGPLVVVADAWFAGGIFLSVLALLAVVTVAVFGFVAYNRRHEVRTAALEAPLADADAETDSPVVDTASLHELDAEAARLLIQTDDAIRSGERELDLAVARFGGSAVARPAANLETARRDLAEAFRLRRSLDAGPDRDDAERHRILRQVVDRCADADAALDEQSAAIERLRDRER